jgi:hypothetical protein
MKIEDAQKAAWNAERMRLIEELIGRLDEQDAPNGIGGSRYVGYLFSFEGSGPMPTEHAARDMRAILRRDMQEQYKGLIAEQLALGVDSVTR